jgi:hypothetical protein
MSFDYEPLVWDLNPEGVGVQPMIANVNMSFKIIGGSDLSGPITKLQNALSFNYFANTQVYDSRADLIKKDSKSNSGYNLETGDLEINNEQSITISEQSLTELSPEINILGEAEEASKNQETQASIGVPKLTGMQIMGVTSNATDWNIDVIFVMENITNVGEDNETAFGGENALLTLSNTLGNKFKQIFVNTTTLVNFTTGSRGTISFSLSDFPTGLYGLSLEGKGIRSNVNLI